MTFLIYLTVMAVEMVTNVNYPVPRAQGVRLCVFVTEPGVVF